ncbi:MAG TPA: sodium transporter, partial [Bacteroidota bacterium]|nr:sodium transporter [Bacteroidota bacterium]
PFIGKMSDERMFVYLQSVSGYIAPPISACFLFGILWKRANRYGAMSALLTGLVLGSARFVLEIRHKTVPLENEFLKFVATVNFLHYAAFLFADSSLVLVIVSLSTPPPSRDQLVNLTVGEVDGSVPLKSRWNGVNAVASVILVMALLFLWWTFR